MDPTQGAPRLRHKFHRQGLLHAPPLAGWTPCRLSRPRNPRATLSITAPLPIALPELPEGSPSIVESYWRLVVLRDLLEIESDLFQRHVLPVMGCRGGYASVNSARGWERRHQERQGNEKQKDCQRHSCARDFVASEDYQIPSVEEWRWCLVLVVSHWNGPRWSKRMEVLTDDMNLVHFLKSSRTISIDILQSRRFRISEVLRTFSLDLEDLDVNQKKNRRERPLVSGLKSKKNRQKK